MNTDFPNVNQEAWFTSNDDYNTYQASIETVQESNIFIFARAEANHRADMSTPFFRGVPRRPEATANDSYQ